MAEPRKDPGPLRVLLWTLYDFVWIGLSALIYGAGAYAAYTLLHAAWKLAGPVGVAFTALPAYILALLVVVLIVSGIRLASPRIVPGIYRKFSRGTFFALVWHSGLNNVLFAMPFMRTINFIAFLRFLYYRGMGMKTHFGNWISVEAVIMDPSLVTLGRQVNIGGMAAMTCHVGLQDAMVILPISIGNHVIIGAATKIGPGVEIGDHALIGADVGLGMKVKVGEGAYVEPFSRVEANTVIGAYEKWAGTPAQKVGTRPRPKTAPVPEEAAS